MKAEPNIDINPIRICLIAPNPPNQNTTIVKAKESGSENNNVKTILNIEEIGDIFKKKDCICKSCSKYCSEDYMYATTFIGRLIMTFYSFQALFFLYNFIINFIFLLPGMLFYTEYILILILVFLVYIFLASFCSNILIIPTYELLLFPYLRHKNTLAHLESLKIVINIIHDNNHKNDKIEFKKSNFLLDIGLIVIEISYLIGFCCGFSSETIIVKDIIREIIYILIYTDYLIIIFGYIIISIDLKVHLFSEMKKNLKDRLFITNIHLYIDEYINDFFQDKPALPKINLLCYVINPLLKNSYDDIAEAQDIDKGNDCFNCCRNLFTCKLDCTVNTLDKIKDCCPCCCKDCSNRCSQNCCDCCVKCCSCCSSCGSCDNIFHTFKNMIRLIIFVLSFIIAIFISVEQKSGIVACIIIFFVSVFFYFLSSLFNFPYIIRNKEIFCLFTTKKSYKKEYNLEHPILIAFIRLVSFLIIILVSIALLIMYALKDESSGWIDLTKINFKPEKDKKDKTKLKPNICYSSIHNLYIQLYLPFIIDAYYYDDNPEIAPDRYSSLQIPNYRQLFFDDDTYEIKAVGNLIKSKEINKVKMIHYDIGIINKEEDGSIKIINNITILSIKGTTNKKDMFLDLQLYLPSILLNYLSYFSIFNQRKDTYSFGYLEYSLSLPYRLFSQYLIIDGYLRDLLTAYNDNLNNFKDNIIIVGHSLGGGLAKILGRFLRKQAISLSGPGVNAFQSLWEYEGSSENFEISAIDLVPDMDLVPRVEVSGGTIYRIICKEGPLDCHVAKKSICEVLIMCQNPNSKQYCLELANFTQRQIDAVNKSAEL